MYAHAYRETFVCLCLYFLSLLFIEYASTPVQNTTIMIAETVATPFELDFLGDHEWSVRLLFLSFSTSF
jgi:hypothetical protein